ncbi:RAMP superfamily CRISPR-associated protein [Streptomyces sp. NPDC007856]|uniref:RAMP superfamily CRISPR-associated protein n=1 Tax=Streptomyces sp. NPDC007856 TaxID=3364781 RepID=UPI0036A1C9F0
MTELALTVTMLGDWHVGTGTGRHAFVDRLLQRDGHDLPYIPAKTLTGVWRDGCETVVHALDGGAPGPWQEWLEFLFGSQPALEELGVIPGRTDDGPRPAAVFLDSLHYPADLADALGGKPMLRQAVTFLKPGVAIDDATGRAEDKKLRFEEMARGGATLSGRAAIRGAARLDEEQLKCASALLDAGARLVESIGGKRRRGAGRCRISLQGPPADWKWLRDRPSPPPLPDPVGVTAPGAPAAAEPQDRWEGAELRLVLRRPLVAHARTVGNAVRSAAFVPGSALLPAVLQRLDCPEAALAARRGDLVVTNATVEVDGRLGQPVPLALVHGKSSTTWSNLLTCAAPGGGPAEPFEDDYTAGYRPGEPLAVQSCTRTEHTHNTIDDRRQRPVEEVGGLYTYQAMAAGTELRAQVRVPEGLLPAGWQERLNGTWRLGRSRKDGYGLTEVTAGPAGTPAARTVPPGPLRVWLLSDVLVTDERLRPSSRPQDLAAELGRALGVQLRPVADLDGSGALGRVSEPRRFESWHQRWGLPRASLLGIRAGSCLSFEIVGGTLTPQAVQRVETAGVGLRRAEGFGQLRIGDPLLYAETGETAQPEPDGTGTGQTTAEPDFPDSVLQDHGGLVDILEEAAWRQEIRRHSEKVARDRRAAVLGENHIDVPPSQLGALRMLVSRLSGPGDGQAETWLSRLRPTQEGQELRRGWPEDTVTSLTALLRTDDRIWALLDLPEEKITAAASRISRLRARLWPEAVRTLVEDCLTAHACAARERGED